MPPSSQRSPSRPCPSCPWRRDVTPGTLGGSPAETFIGQAHGAFPLPCHCRTDFSDPEWRLKAINSPQCAGAAIYRANTGVAPSLPDFIHHLPADRTTVFAAPEEFLAHHNGCSVEHAGDLLAITPPAALTRRQLARTSNILWLRNNDTGEAIQLQ